MGAMADNYEKYHFKLPNIVYHYCSVPTLLSILTNKCIWVSDAYSSNDKSELCWLLEQAKKIFPEIFLKQIKTYKPQMVDISDKYIIYFDSLVDSFKIKNSLHKKVYICCFSRNNNSLDQWRAYGQDGQGVAIGFNAKILSDQNNSTCPFKKVRYGPKYSKPFLENLLNDQLKYILLSYKDNASDIFNDLRLALFNLAHAIYSEGYLYKDLHFSHEEEWRLLREVADDNYNTCNGIDEDYGFSSLDEGFLIDNNTFKFTRSKIKFRCSNNSIIPYFEFGFSKVQSVIKRIIIGPKCKIDSHDLKLLLLSEGYINSFYDEHIKILSSEIPYI